MEPIKLTVKEWLGIWTSTYLNDVRSSTKDLYTQYANNYIIPHLGAVKLIALSPSMIQLFYNMVFGTVICLLIPGQLMGLFTHTEVTIQAGETALRIIGAGFIVSAVSVTSSGALEGLGKGTPSLLISLCRYVVVIIPAAFLLSRFFGAVGVWNAFWITEAITAIISICVYYKAIHVYDFEATRQIVLTADA